MAFAMPLAALASAGAAIYGATQKPNIPRPPRPVPPPKMETANAEDARKLMPRRRGRSETILGGELEPTNLGRKTLLG